MLSRIVNRNCMRPFLNTFRAQSDFVASTRKKKTAAPQEQQNQNQDASLPQFVNISDVVPVTLAEIVEFLEPLTLTNDYKFENHPDYPVNFDVGDKGTYRFRYDHSIGRLIMRSPVSGSQQYVFDMKERRWIGAIDGHDFFGLLTRDLLRHSIGLPLIK